MPPDQWSFILGGPGGQNLGGMAGRALGWQFMRPQSTPQPAPMQQPSLRGMAAHRALLNEPPEGESPLGGAAKSAVTGGMAGGPWGALAAGGLGLLGGALGSRAKPPLQVRW